MSSVEVICKLYCIE